MVNSGYGPSYQEDVLVERNTVASTTAEDRAYWAKNGHLSVERAFSASDVGAVQASLDALFDRFDQLPEGSTHAVDLPGSVHGSLEIVLATKFDPSLSSSPVLEACHRIANDLLGCDARLYFDHVIRKPAHIGTGTAWHQDQAYNLSEPNRHRVHFWIPMADVDVDGGCMQFVQGSQNWGLVGHHPLSADPKKHSLEADGEYDADSTPAPLRVGDVSMHTTLTMHKTGPNVSDVTRTAWILHFVRPRTFREHLTAATAKFRPAQPTRL